MQKFERIAGVTKQFITTALSIGYDFVIISIAVGVFGAALILLHDIVTDFFVLGSANHTFAHLVSDLMLALIMMALLEQVLQIIRKHPFSPLPFIAIGLIASVRGFLIVQIKIAMEEIGWADGLVQLGSYATMTIAMAGCYYILARKVHEKA